MSRKPNISRSEQQLEKAAEKFDEFAQQVKSLSVDEKANLPSQETEPQTKLSKKEANSLDAPVIKPNRAIFSKEKFNEKMRSEYEVRSKLVKCIVENNEIIGERIEKWTKRWPGEPAHFWQIPVNKPIYLPKFLAEELQNCCYHRLVMEEAPQTAEGALTHSLVSKETRHRLDCRSVGFASGF